MAVLTPVYFGWIFESYRKGGCKHVQYVGGEREGERHPHIGLEFNFLQGASRRDIQLLGKKSAKCNLDGYP